MATFNFPASFYQQQVPNLGHSLRVNSILFTPDGTKIISASWKILISDANTGEEVKTILLGGSSRDVIDAMAIAPDSKTLAVASRTGHVIQLWDIEKEVKLAVLEGHKKTIRSLLFSSDGKSLISAGNEGKIYVWDLTKYKLDYSLRCHKHGVSALALHSESKHLASGSPDGEVKVWNLNPTKLVFDIKKHKNLISALAFTQDGTKLASASWDRNIGIWNIKTVACEHILTAHKNGVENVSFSSDNKALMSSSYDRIDKLGTMIFWNLQTGKPAHTLVGNFYRQTMGPDNSTVILVSANGKVKTLLNATPEEFLESETQRRDRRLDERRRGPLPFEGEDRRKKNEVERRKGQRRLPKPPSDTVVEVE